MSYLGFEGRFLDHIDRASVVSSASSLQEIRERLQRHFGWIPERHRKGLVLRIRSGWANRRKDEERLEDERELGGFESTESAPMRFGKGSAAVERQ